jgi:RNA polymerase sigma factor for flagellar operon FliA
MSVLSVASQPSTSVRDRGQTGGRAGAEVDRLVIENLPLVGHLVQEIATRLPAHVSRDDLLSVGMTALVISSQGFDATRGVPFARFAAIRIRGALVDELRSMDWASRSVRSRAREVDAVRNQMTTTLGRSPNPVEVAGTLGMTVTELNSIDADVHRAGLLSLQGAGSETGAVMMPDSRRGPEQLLLDREQLGYLHDAIAELPDRLRQVVRSYYLEQRPMAEIAVELGVTESRISQLRAEALRLLRHGLAHAQAEAKPTPEPTRGAAARVASYAAAVASRSTLASRLHRSTAMGDVVSATAYG